MEYNTQRESLIIPEYGRNIQNMVQFACTIEDRDERNICAQAIIKVMGQLNPHLRDVEEFKPKLWAHLLIMSEWKLDVDSPYPRPTPETFKELPKRVPYPNHRIRFKHYGRTAELLIAKCLELEEGKDRDDFTFVIANMMKKAYLTWNRDSVEDELIIDNLATLSEGKLQLPIDTVLTSTAEILKSIPQQPTQNKKKKNNKNKNKKKK